MSITLNESGTASKDLDFAQRVTMLFAVEAAALSGLSIAVLLLYKIYHTIRRAIRTRGFTSSSDACDSTLFMSLMIGETLRAVGKLMSVRWIQEARITAPTGYCTAQGMVQLIGTNIIDWSTLGIAIQTWEVLVAQWSTSRHFVKYLTLGVWAVCSLIVGVTIGSKGLGIIGPAGSWCWITPNYRAEQILSEYLWMWIILVLTFVFYTIDVLVIRGYVTVHGRFRLRWVARNRVHLQLTQAETEVEREERQMAVQLFFYPLVYLLCVLPFSITRWMVFSGHAVPYQAAAFTSCLFTLSGLFNVVLFFRTRPQLIKGGDDEPESGIVLPPQPSPSEEKRLPPLPEKSDGYLRESGGYDDTKLTLHTGYISPTSRGRVLSPGSVASILQRDSQISQSPGRTPTDYDYDDVGYLPK